MCKCYRCSMGMQALSRLTPIYCLNPTLLLYRGSAAAAEQMSDTEKKLKEAAMTAAKDACIDAAVAVVLNKEGSYMLKEGDDVYSRRLNPSKVRETLGK